MKVIIWGVFLGNWIFWLTLILLKKVSTELLRKWKEQNKD